jgi:hypothetical protein
MRKYRSGIGQNAEVSPLGQSVEPWNSLVIRTVLFISRYVAIPAFAQPLLRPLPQAASAANPKFATERAAYPGELRNRDTSSGFACCPK